MSFFRLVGSVEYFASRQLFFQLASLLMPGAPVFPDERVVRMFFFLLFAVDLVLLVFNLGFNTLSVTDASKHSLVVVEVVGPMFCSENFLTDTS